jgi:uncharacterized membrane protein HdeD (DUF308 family)
MIALAEHWWLFVVRGLIAIILGVISIFFPGITLGALVFLFGAYALIDGVMNLMSARRSSRIAEPWALHALIGIAGVAAAVITVMWPAITAIALVSIVAAWALITGVFEIVAAVRLRKEISGEWLMALSGIASIVFGFLLITFPIAGAFAIAVAVGVYLIFFGVVLIGLGLRLRGWMHRLYPRAPMHAPSH